jgi:hypothetical protein
MLLYLKYVIKDMLHCKQAIQHDNHDLYQTSQHQVIKDANMVGMKGKKMENMVEHNNK